MSGWDIEGTKRIKHSLLIVLVIFTRSVFADQGAIRSSDTAKSMSIDSSASVLFHDVHFHPTNYIQKGVTIGEFLKIIGNKIGRVAVFGIPLQQKWDHSLSGYRAPTYYLHSDARLYYYSFVDAIIAHEYLKLFEQERKRFDPMITGFNPTDLYASAHIERVLKMYPGVFVGIGEFSIHKEFVSSKIAGHAASLKNRAVNEILAFAGKVGLLALIHNDIDIVNPPEGQKPAYFEQMRTLLHAHPETTIIWAHTGLGRVIKPSKEHLQLLQSLLADVDLKHLYFDISWDEVAKYVVADEQSTQGWANLINAYADRFLFGTDAVAPKDRPAYLKTYNDYQPLWDKLDPSASHLVRIGNYERLFNEANRKVRAWEQLQLEEPKVAVQ